MKISKQNFVVYLCVFFTAFQMVLSENVWNGFSYTDEILAIICFFICVTCLTKHKEKMTKHDSLSIFVLFLIFFVGIIGNLVSGVQNNLMIIFLDVIATFKNFIIYYAFKLTFTTRERNLKTIHAVAKIFRLYIIVCALFAAVNLLFDISMSSGVDFGIKNFKFIFEGPGNYAMVFYIISFVVLIDLAMKNYVTQADKLIVILMLFAWAASMTTRSIAFVILFFGMYSMNKYSKKLKAWQIAILIIICVIIGSSTIEFYFSAESDTARAMLLRYSFVVLKRYFPIGAGFAAYASNMAAEHYSKLYSEFGFNSVWGLAKSNPRFANDSFWPEIIGQFGVVGIILSVILLVLFYKKIMKLDIVKNEKIVLQWVFLVFLIGSTGTKTYIHFVTIGAYIILALYENVYVYDEKNNSKRKRVV